MGTDPQFFCPACSSAALTMAHLKDKPECEQFCKRLRGAISAAIRKTKSHGGGRPLGAKGKKKKEEVNDAI